MSSNHWRVPHPPWLRSKPSWHDHTRQLGSGLYHVSAGWQHCWQLHWSLLVSRLAQKNLYWAIFIRIINVHLHERAWWCSTLNFRNWQDDFYFHVTSHRMIVVGNIIGCVTAVALAFSDLPAASAYGKYASSDLVWTKLHGRMVVSSLVYGYIEKLTPSDAT